MEPGDRRLLSMRSRQVPRKMVARLLAATYPSTTVLLPQSGGPCLENVVMRGPGPGILARIARPSFSWISRRAQKWVRESSSNRAPLLRG